MNILIINNNLFQSGGDWTYIRTIAQIYKQHGHNVFFWGVKRESNIIKDNEDLFPTSINLSVAKKKIIKYFFPVIRECIYSKKAKSKISTFLDRYHIDIVQLNTIRLGVTPSIITPIKERGIPIVWRMIDYYQICPNIVLRHHHKNCQSCVKGQYYNCVVNNCKNSIMSSLLVTIEAYFYKYRDDFDQIDVYSLQNNFTKNLLLKAGYQPEKLVVQYNPYDSNLITPSFNLGDSVLYFGRLEEEKGVNIIISAAVKLPKNKFVIVGVGSAENALKQYVKDNNINNVEFLGAVWGSDLDIIIKQCRCVVVPSLWQEVSSYVAFQAYANARPVLASDIGGLPEVVIDGYNGLLFKPGDVEDLVQKIMCMFNNEEMVSMMGKNALSFVKQQHSIEAYYNDTISLFNYLINKIQHNNT